MTQISPPPSGGECRWGEAAPILILPPSPPPPKGRGDLESISREYRLPTHILPKQQDTITVLEFTIEAMADTQDSAIHHNFNMFPQFP
jgi:hypothetical protein